jgi:glutamate 5-kinase
VGGSFVDLQKPMRELDGKPCAAVGQSGLMALYDSLFTQVPIPFSTFFFVFCDQNMVWFGLVFHCI